MSILGAAAMVGMFGGRWPEWDNSFKLPNPATLPTGIGHGVSFSPDGTYLSVAHTDPPYLTIYKAI